MAVPLAPAHAAAGPFPWLPYALAVALALLVGLGARVAFAGPLGESTPRRLATLVGLVALAVAAGLGAFAAYDAAFLH